VPGSDAFVCSQINAAWSLHNPFALKSADLLLDRLCDVLRVRADPVLLIEGGLRYFFLGATLRSRLLLLLLLPALPLIRFPCLWFSLPAFLLVRFVNLEALLFHFLQPVLRGRITGASSLVSLGFGSRACVRGLISAVVGLRHGDLLRAVRKLLRHSLL